MLSVLLTWLAENPGTAAVILPALGSLALEILKRYSPGLAKALGWVRLPAPATPGGSPAPAPASDLSPLMAFIQQEVRAIEDRLLARLQPKTPPAPPAP
jgi:hypothetical protein